ncbi:hypothetical protein BH11ARM1_BH11ARM1_03680 [soil metagenome]
MGTIPVSDGEALDAILTFGRKLAVAGNHLEVEALMRDALSSLGGTNVSLFFGDHIDERDQRAEFRMTSLDKALGLVRLEISAESAALVQDVCDRAATHLAQLQMKQGVMASDRFLSKASKILGQSIDYATTLDALANLLVPDLGDWCTIYEIQSGEVHLMSVKHIDLKKQEWARSVEERYPARLGASSTLSEVLTTGRGHLEPTVTPAMLETEAVDYEHLRELNELEIASAMIVPLVSNDEILGAMTLLSSVPGQFQEAHFELAVELGRRAGMAIDHARIFKNVGLLVEQRTEELQAANRELESFAYSVSHDLRAPLRSVMSSSMIVIEDYGDKIDEEGKQELLRASNAAKRMSKLIDDLLQYSRLGRRDMNPREVDLSDIAVESAKELGIPAESLAITPGLVAKADPDLMRVLLTNLLENAWKFSKNAAEPRIEFFATSEGFSVRDNGVGFSMEFVDKLFVPFERLHSPKDYPGTGIGLANVKRIVNRHGGRVWAYGEEGKGATLSFSVGSTNA